MRTITKTVYTIDEHPNKEAVYQWINDNWHDLNEHGVSEVIDSLKALQKIIGGKLDYCISQVPDRGEFISFTDYDDEALNNLNPDECELTGVCYDFEVIHFMQRGNIEAILDSIHDETEYLYSNQALYDLCQANEYEFYEDGEIA